MKRVSFEVAKAIKKAGYKFTPAPASYFVDDDNSWWDSEYGELFTQPTYLEVWLWLWRNKNVQIDVDYAWYNTAAITSTLVKGEEFPDVFEKKDPEEAIAAIRHLVDKDLIK